MQKHIRYSKEESEFFGLRIGRADTINFRVEDFKKAMVAGKFDVIRFRVGSNDSRTIKAIQAIDCPVHNRGAIVKYELPVLGLGKTEYINPEISLRVYTGEDPNSVKRIIEGGSAKNPIGYWSTSGMEKFLSREDEVKYLTNYYSELYVTPERQLWFMQWNGDPVGFVASNFAKGIMDTPLAVVLPEFRGKKLLHEIMISRNNYGIEHGLRLITNGARKNNDVSQHVFTKFGMKTVGEDLVFHLLPFLNVET
jgi:hypothetical protein